MNSDKRNSFWLALQFIISFSSTLITLKLNLDLYGKELFSIWLLLFSLWGMGASLDLGFGLTVVKYVANYNKHNKDKINELVSTIFFVFIFFGIFVFIILNVTGELLYFGTYKYISSYNHQLFRTVFLLLGIAFLFQYLILFFRSVMEGMNNFVISSKINLANNIIILIGVLIIYFYKLSMIYLACTYVVASLVIVLAYFLLLIKSYPLLSIKKKLFNLVLIKELISYSISVQSVSFFLALIDPAMKYVIATYFRLDMVSVFEIARRAALAISGLFMASFKIILPKTSVLKTKEQYRDFLLTDGIKYVKMGLTYSGITYGILSLPIILFLKYWFRMDEIVLFFLLLSLPEIINNVGYTIYNFILGIGKAYFIVLVQFINVTIITSSLILGFSLFRNIFGIFGYFFTVVFVNFLMLLFVKKHSDVSLKQFLIRIRFKNLLSLLSMHLLVITFIYFFPVYTIIYLTLMSLVAFIIFRKEIKQYFQLMLNKIDFAK